MSEPFLEENLISLGHWLRYWMEQYQQPKASTVVTVTSGETESSTWNHAENSSDACATPLDEPNGLWWMEVVDADNIKIHLASADLSNNHTFRVMVF